MKDKIKLFFIMVLIAIMLYSSVSGIEYSMLNSNDVKLINNTVENTNYNKSINLFWFNKESDTKFLYKDKTMLGIYPYIKSIYEDTFNKVTLVDNVKDANLLLGPSYVFDLKQYNISNSFYEQIYYIYSNKSDINSIYDISYHKIGVLSNIPVVSFAKRFSFLENFQIKKYDTYEKLKNALLTNQVDVIIHDQEMLEELNNPRLKIIPLHEMSTSYVFAIPKDENYELITDINKWLYKCKYDNYFQSQLQDIIFKYYHYKLPFTETEKEWLKNNQKVSFGIIKDYKPYHILNQNNYEGISKEVLDDLRDILGIDFELKDITNIYSIEEILNQCKKGDIVFVPFVSKSLDEHDLIYTNPVYKTDLMVISNNHTSYISDITQLNNKKIVLSDQWLKDYVNYNLRNATIINEDDIKNIFKSIKKNKAEYSLVDQYILNYELKSQNYNFEVVGKIEDALQYHIAINKDHKPFQTILNKILPLINTQKYYQMYSIFYDDKGDYFRILIFIILLIILLNIVIIYLVRIKQDIKDYKNKSIQLIKLNSKYEDTLFQMIAMLERASVVSRNYDMYHKRRIVCYAEILAREYGCEEAFIDELVRYISIHDIGNISVNSSIFNKVGILLPKEKQEVKKHVLTGINIVKKLNLGEIAENMIKYHHENWDGTGYPEGLKEKDIPIEARIVHIVDRYDQLRLDRSYRKGYSHQKAVKIIEKQKNKQFDPILIDIFLNNHMLFNNIFEMSLQLWKKRNKKLN